MHPQCYSRWACCEVVQLVTYCAYVTRPNSWITSSMLSSSSLHTHSSVKLCSSSNVSIRNLSPYCACIASNLCIWSSVWNKHFLKHTSCTSNRCQRDVFAVTRPLKSMIFAGCVPCTLETIGTATNPRASAYTGNWAWIIPWFSNALACRGIPPGYALIQNIMSAPWVFAASCQCSCQFTCHQSA